MAVFLSRDVLLNPYFYFKKSVFFKKADLHNTLNYIITLQLLKYSLVVVLLCSSGSRCAALWDLPRSQSLLLESQFTLRLALSDSPKHLPFWRDTYDKFLYLSSKLRAYLPADLSDTTTTTSHLSTRSWLLPLSLLPHINLMSYNTRNPNFTLLVSQQVLLPHYLKMHHEKKTDPKRKRKRGGKRSNYAFIYEDKQLIFTL